jgi:hypothetical protein
LGKETLNSDGQHFQQYQQSKQSPHTLKGRQLHMTLAMKVQALDRNIHFAELKLLMGSKHPPLDNWVSNNNAYVNKR